MARSAVDSHAGYAALIARLDLEAKVGLLTGAAAFNLAAQEEIGLGELRMSDGPTGVRGLKFSGGPQVALLPNASLLAQSWSADTLGEIGRILAEEALAQQIHVVLGPTINLHRSPLGGRLFEAFSEDPLLTGRLAVGYVRGLQALGVGACLKHLVANESETLRNTMNSVVDEATLRELYLLPFELALQDGGAWTVMAAYNDVNGLPATEQSHVNTEILKQEWGFDGLIMSDWFATKSAGPAANGGLDLVMPGPAGPWGEALVAAVKGGEVAESVIDEHLTRLLRLAERVGVLGEPRTYPTALPAPDSPQRRQELTRLAASSMVVLTNRHTNQELADGGAVLPLHAGAQVALIGRHAVETIDMGGGSAQVNPPYQVSVAQGLSARLTDVVVVDGVEVRTRPVAARTDTVADPQTGRPGLRVLLYARDGSLIQERHHRSGSVMVGLDDDFTEPVDRVVLRAVVHPGGPAGEQVELGGIGVGDWTLTCGDHTETFSLRSNGSGFGEEVLTPPGQAFEVRLGESAASRVVELEARKPRRPDGTPSTGSPFADGTVGLYGLIARPSRRPTDVALAEAVAAAQNAEVAVIVVGLTEEQETEAVDKSTLRLPGDQDALVSAVAAVAHRSVVVVNAATPVLMPWLEEVDAVLWAGLPGQEGGHAVAAALLGQIEPAGRLVTTFPVADGATPAWSVTPVDLQLEYTEGTAIGYRGFFAGRAPTPLFWFGHGLGYTSWQYDDAELVPADADGASTPGVRLRVTNTGVRSGREVVQVYFQPAEPDQPIRLAGWQDVTLEPGTSAVVEVATEPRMWRHWDSGLDGWGSLGVGGRLIVARGLGDVRAEVDLA